MILLMYMLKDNPYRPVLGFRDKTSLENAIIKSAGERSVRIDDDYGQTFLAHKEDIVGRVITDLDKNNQMKVERAIARMKAENQFQRELQNDQTLSFLVGNAGSIFPPEE